MTVNVMRSQYKGWYIEAIFCPKMKKWMAYFFDQYENRIVNLSDSVRIFATPEEALIFAQTEVNSRIEEEEISERFSALIDELLAKGVYPSRILWSLGYAIERKGDELGIDAEELLHQLCMAATKAPGWK